MDATLPRVRGAAKRSSRSFIPAFHAELVPLAHFRSGRRHPARFLARLGPLALAFALAFGVARAAGAARTVAQGGAPALADSTAPRAAAPSATPALPPSGAPAAQVRAAARPDSLARPDTLSRLATPARPDSLARPDSTARADSLARAARPAAPKVPAVPPTPLGPGGGYPPFLPDSLKAAFPDTSWHLAGLGGAPFDTTLLSRDYTAGVKWSPRMSHLAIPKYVTGKGPFQPADPGRFTPSIDARAVSVTVDPAADVVHTAMTAADVSLSDTRDVPIDDYAKGLTRLSFRRTWVAESLRRISNTSTEVQVKGKKGPLEFHLPIQLPKAAQFFVGSGGPALNVSGSERISISGTSQWDNRSSGTGVKPSLFPQLDMRQDLNIALNGQLGDKAHIDVNQNSVNVTPLSNRIGIHYVGDENEVVKEFDLGNTNLSLPGTQYVSYSGRNEGLFGVKTSARLGSTDLDLIASKQEGRSERKSFQGTAQSVERRIDDINYIHGKYFFLQRPTEQLATNSRIEIGTLRVFVDDRNGSNDQGVRVGTTEIDPTQPKGATPGFVGAFDLLQELKDYEVTLTYYGERFPVLVLKSAISPSEVLAVSYQEKLADGTVRQVGFVPDCPTDPNAPCDSVRLKLLQAPIDRLPPSPTDPTLYDTSTVTSPFVSTRDYEVKSFYDLQTANIDPKTLTLQVRRYDANIDQSNDGYKEGNQVYSYLQIMGVDLFTDSGSGAATDGPDQFVDNFTNASFLDTQAGILFFPDLRPFDPRVGPRPDARPEENLFYQSRVTGKGGLPIPGPLRKRMFWPETLTNPAENGGVASVPDLRTNPAVYDKRNLDLNTDRRYYIYASFSGQDYSGTIYLGQTNLLDGSEVVAVEGVPLVRNTDYTIDYEAGTVTLLTQKARENRAKLTIDYSFAPLFASAGKTLVGSAIGYHGLNRSIGGAFIYESTGEQQARPRLGEEPSRTLIGDAYTQFSVKPQFITRALDKLPFYSTTAESRVDVNGELGVSLPNPNTKNTVYLDDFEGNRDSYSAPMSRGFWKWPSIPLVINGAATDTVNADYTELIWYNPYNTVKASDLNPSLTKNEGADNLLTTLDLYIPKAPAVHNKPALWTGLTTTVEPNGTDFSRMQYLEVWVNDWRDDDVRANPNLKLHIDLGIVSEDQQRAPNAPPNGVFDTEDKNHDGKYDPPDASTPPEQNEKGGADGVPDALETDLYDLSTATDADKHGDNRHDATNDQGQPVDLAKDVTERNDPFVYIGPTLSENNKGTYENGSALYTEDLNGNQLLDTENHYITYTLPLGDQQALAKFLIFEADSAKVVVNPPIDPNNGWRRYRIPLDESDPAFRQVIGAGSLSTVKHMRVWLENIDQFEGNSAAIKTDRTVRGRQPLIEIGSIDVVGNRWQIAASDSLLSQANGSIVARNVNNQDDQDIYSPPFHVDSQTTVGGTQTQREQSLALEVTRLPLGSTATVFKTETQPENYTRYGRISFYTRQFGFANADSARYFVRIGYDTQNYYEYSRPIRDVAPAPFKGGPESWTTVTFNLADFSELKFKRPVGAIADTLTRGDERLVVVGSPTFTRVQQFTLGVYSERALVDSSAFNRITNAMSGDVWIDDLRALDVDRARGTADRLTVNTQLADLLTLTTNWDHTDENFQSLGQTGGSDVNSSRLAFSGTFAPHKFIAPTGIQLPVTFTYAKATSTPRLFTGTDVILTPDEAASQRSTSIDRGVGVSFSKTGDRNFLLRNTIDRVGLNFAFSDRVYHSPTENDSSRTLTGGGSFTLSPGDWLKIPLPGWKSHGTTQKLLLLPTSASITFNQQTQRAYVFKRGLDDPVGQYALQSNIYRKTSLYNLAASWRPLPLGSYSVNATRDAAVPGIVPRRIFGVNFGTMTNLTSRIDSRITVRAIPFLTPALDFGTTYGEVRTPDLSPDLSLGQFNNSTSAGLSFDLPFVRFANVGRRATTPSKLTSALADTAKRDTSAAGKKAPPASRGFSLPIGKLLARLGTVNFRGSFNRNTNFSRYYGVPSVPYRLGIARSPNTQWNQTELLSIFPGPQSTDNAQTTWSGDASTQLTLIGRSSVRTRGNYTATNREYNGQFSANSTFTFPDVDVDWGSVHKLLGLGHVFPQLGARTRFSRVESKEGQVLSDPTSITTTRNFQPLLSLQGTTRGQAQVQMSIENTNSSRADLSSRRATRNEGSTTMRASISRTYLPGQRVPLFGGKAGLKSTLTLQADGAYTKRTGSTEAAGIASTKTNTDQIDINTSTTYAFSTYVNGTLGLGFTQTRDLQTRNPDGAPITQRSLRLEASASFRF